MRPEEANRFYEEDEDPARVFALLDAVFPVEQESPMSEPGGTEATGFAQPDPQFAPAADAESLGVQAVAAGAQADEVDPAALLAMLKAQQAKIDQLIAERNLATAPDVVKYATALADHLQVKADANPAIHADPDHTWMPALELAAGLVNSAQAAAASGQAGDIPAQVGRVRQWVARHQRRFPHMDYGYISDLADETEAAAAKLAA